MKRPKALVFIGTLISAVGLVFLVSVSGARAAVSVTGPPIDVLFGNQTAGGGAYIPLVQFKLAGDGSSTLTNVKVGILASTTPTNLTNGEINKLYLYKESGTKTGFQPTEDTLLNTGDNTVTDPATSTAITITVDTAQNSISATPTDYYVIAKATTSPALTNGHAFYATTTASWITTSTGAVGTEFIGQRKITLQRTGNLKISEVKQGGTSNAGDEFVELYNASEMAIDLNVLPLNLYLYNAAGGAGLKTLTYYNSVIPKQGFFLMTSQTNYSGSVPPDAVYTTLSGNTLLTNSGLAIATSSTLANATSSAIDRIWFGAAGQATNGEGTQLSNLAADKSYERKAVSGSDASSMANGGVDATKGNSQDSNDNSADFVLQNTPNPQNTTSPSEFPFGGGGQDTEKPKIMGSYPGFGQTNVPKDLTFIGFGFNKMLQAGTISSNSATTTVTLTGGSTGSTNLCSSVIYNPFPGNFEPPAKCILTSALEPSATYTFTATSTILDLSGNGLDQDPFTAGNQAYQITFTTGGATQTMTNTTPPSVTGTTPFQGSSNIPTNLAKIFVKFNLSNMNSSTLNSSTITLTKSGGSATLSSFSYDATTSILSFVPSALSANTTYTLTVSTGVRSSNGIGLPMTYASTFTTGSADDNTAPNVVGIVPAPGQKLTLNAVDFVFSMDDNLDITTATSGAVTLTSGGSNLPGTVSYDPIAKEGHFTATNLLPANVTDLTLNILHGNLKNISGTALSADRSYIWSTETTNTDSTGPSVMFANADQFNLAVTFNEAVKSTDATNLANYALTVGSNSITLSSMAGHTITYDASKRTAKITGLFLQPAVSFTVTVSNVKDISGNAMSGSSAFTGTVLSPQVSGGALGPGDTSGNFGPKMTDFSSAGIGFMPGMKVMPMNMFVSASTTYGFELPISQKIPANGTIVVTFPQSSDFGICCAANTDSNNSFVTTQNTDINGPGDNTVGFTVAKNQLAKTVTLTLTAATNTEGHDFLRFALVDIKNPSIPKGRDSSGYTLDIKTKNSSGTLLESFTSSPIYITGGGVSGSATTTIQGSVTGNGTGLVGVNIRMGSSQTGMVATQTDSSGNYSFTNIPVNPQISSFGGGSEFMLFTDPIISGISDVNGATTTAFFGEPMPTPVSATSTSVITRNFVLTATSSAINFTVKITGDNSSNSIFSSNEKIDIFAGGPGKFISQTYTTATTNYNATAVSMIPIPQVNGSWGIGVGPSMPKMMGNMNFGPPPAPAWVVPKPVEVIVSGCPSACIATVNGSTATSYTFTISAANKQIIGVLKDGSGNLVSSAEVFAFSPGQGVGNRAQTSSAGVFTIKVAAGSYNVGAFIPGIGRSSEVPVVVDSSNVYVNGATLASTGATGANPFILTIKKSSYTITGSVTDGTNAVSNAPVFAYRTDGPGHIDAMTDSSGNYTLYVDAGTWKVNSFIPGFGPMSEQTVTVTTSSQSNINFAPSSATTYKTISGIVFESSDASIATSTEGVSGVIIRVSGTNGTNETITGSDGTYSLRVPAGTYSFTDIFKPGYGKIAPVNHALTAITSINANADVYKAIRINSRNTVQVVVKDSNGSPLTVSKAFIDLFDPTYQLGNHAEITNATSTSLQIATGTAPLLRAFVQGVPPANVSVSSDNAQSVVSAGTLTVDNTTEYIKIVVNTSSVSLSTVSGKVYAGSASSGNELADTWVQFVDPTNNVHFGTQATSSGIYVLTLANGTYQVQAMKSGYVSTPTTLTVSGGTSSANVVVSSAASTITGTVTAGGSLTSGAFVWAEKKGGGFSTDKTDTSGAFTLKVDSGQWAVYASAEGYQKGGGSTVNAGASGVAIALTSAASGISSKTVSSNAFTDSSAGTFSDSTLGLKVNLDGGSLGSSGSSGYLSAKQTTNLPQTLDTKIIGSKGMDIDATNGSSAVTNLQSGKKAEITLNYTKADLTADGVTTTTGVGNLKIMSWSDDKKAWESLTTVATYKDSDGNPVASPASNLSNVASVDFTTSEASHFSEYALGAPSNADAPSTPAGLAVSQSSTNFNVTLTWTANTESDLSGYYVYRSTDGSSYPLLATLGNVTTYTNSSLSSGSTYYYKISAYDTDGNESAAGSAVTITVAARGSGGGISGGSDSPSGSTGGGGSGSSAASSPTTAAARTTTATALTSSAVSQSSVKAQAISPVFTKNISVTSRGDDVKRLQQLLKQDKTIYPEGVANGVYGPATARAVKAFQKKYGIAQTGSVGPATRAKIQEVFGGSASQAKTSIATPTSSATRATQTKALQDQLKALQKTFKQLKK